MKKLKGCYPVKHKQNTWSKMEMCLSGRAWMTRDEEDNTWSIGQSTSRCSHFIVEFIKDRSLSYVIQYGDHILDQIKTSRLNMTKTLSSCAIKKTQQELTYLLIFYFLNGNYKTFKFWIFSQTWFSETFTKT